MKVLFVQKVAGISGSEIYLLNIIPALRNKGVDVHFLCLFEEEAHGKAKIFLDKLQEKQIPCFLIRVKSLPSVSVLIKIKKVIKDNNFDFVHTHLIHADFFLALVKALTFPSLKLVSTKHGYDESYTHKYGFRTDGKYRNLYWSICRFSELFINRSYAISAGLRNLFISFSIAKESKIDLIRYGFDFPNEIGIKSDNYRVGHPQLLIVGRLVPYKGHQFAIEALKIVRVNFPDLKLVVVGGGDLHEELLNLAKKEGLEEIVVFKGFQSNVSDYMANSDILLVPSISEGFGIVFLEAFHHKLPVIAFDVPAANEIVEPNLSGILVKPYEVEALANSIVSLLGSPEKMKAYGERGFSMLSCYYNLTRMVDETVAFYEKAIKN